jgi:hypothetical protein
VATHLSEPDVQSFIIKLWIEKASERAGAAVWRGYITHVPSGRRRYLKDLDEITAFITPYLKAMGVRVGMWGRVRRIFARTREP